nr:MAG TPA: hypothetical protein [Caudoviricetes sp.]
MVLDLDCTVVFTVASQWSVIYCKVVLSFEFSYMYRLYRFASVLSTTFSFLYRLTLQLICKL